MPAVFEELVILIIFIKCIFTTIYQAIDFMEQNSFVSFLKNTLQFYQTTFEFIRLSVKKNLLFSLVLFALFSMAFLLQTSSKQDFYTGKASFTFSYLNKKVYGDRLLSLQELVAEKQYQTVAQLLKINTSTANKLLEFEAKNVAGSPLHEDYTEQKYPFYVHIKATKPAVFVGLEKAIADYLNEQSFDKNYIRFEQDKLRQKRIIFEKDLQRVDSLKKLISVSDLPKYVEAITLVENITNQITAIDKQLNQASSITVLNSFVPIKTAKNGIIVNLGIKYLIAFFLLTIVLSVTLQLSRNLRND